MPQAPASRKKRRKERASVAALQKEGFDILNYNSYYLYLRRQYQIVIRRTATIWFWDKNKDWDLKKWDSNSGKALKTSKHVIGAAVSVWGEDSAGVSADTIYKQVEPLYKAMKKRAK